MTFTFEPAASRWLRLSGLLSLLLHLAVAALVVVFVRGHVDLTPPRPRVLVTLDLQPPAPPKPAVPKSPPPPPRPAPEVEPVPPVITSHPLSSAALPRVPTPSIARSLAPARPLPEPSPPMPAPTPSAPTAPSGPQPGVVGHRISQGYKGLLEQQVGRNLHYPPMAARQGRQGTALVRVRMKRDGTIEQVVLVRSSGSGLLDDEARAVFRRIGKLPPLPPDFLPEAAEFQFVIPIRFRLVGG